MEVIDFMKSRDSHLTDQELLLLADGEMNTRRAARGQAHLAACWNCRTRMQDLEGTIGEVVRARAAALDRRIPDASGPRALLRARLAESPPAKARRAALWRAAPAVAAVASVAIAMLVVFGGTVSAEGPRPKNSLTPGETRPISLSEVCRLPEASADSDQNIPAETRRAVLAEYGMTSEEAGAYEVDYLITPELGGAESIRNLWPQPYSARWNARVKDRLERRLHQLVCQGKVDLKTAQHDISADWIGAYKKYVDTNSPR